MDEEVVNGMGGRVLHQRFTDSKKDEIGLLTKYQMTLASPKDISFWHFGESLPLPGRQLGRFRRPPHP
jgi:hypothetical protein